MESNERQERALLRAVMERKVTFYVPKLVEEVISSRHGRLQAGRDIAFSKAQVWTLVITDLLGQGEVQADDMLRQLISETACFMPDTTVDVSLTDQLRASLTSLAFTFTDSYLSAWEV